tara:strand:+ start:83 stop:811 length:729 start_codon:yes stop_codon:yes gene_type:complete
MANIRIQKIIADADICSRRSAETLIKNKRVKVNGKLVSIGETADPKIEKIFVDNKSIWRRTEYKAILLNKPKGLISTCFDLQGRKTVLNNIPANDFGRLYPVGRLDRDSRGAILITNHGELTLCLTHPSFGHEKTYRVIVKGHPKNDTLEKWGKRIILDGKITMKSEIHQIKSNKYNSLLKIKLNEGRNIQIRKIASALGHPVIDLERIAIGNIQLNKLPEGKWRVLENKEWAHLLQRQYIR